MNVSEKGSVSSGALSPSVITVPDGIESTPEDQPISSNRPGNMMLKNDQGSASGIPGLFDQTPFFELDVG